MYREERQTEGGRDKFIVDINDTFKLMINNIIKNTFNYMIDINNS